MAETHALNFGEILWGVVLIAVTLALHAVGMVATLHAFGKREGRVEARWTLARGIGVLVLAAWMIVLVHLVEVGVWASFLVWRDAFGTMQDAYYFALLQYTTVGSSLSLPERWRLVGGMIAMAGLLTFAWSTTVLLTLAQRFEDGELAALAHRRAASEDAAD